MNRFQASIVTGLRHAGTVLALGACTRHSASTPRESRIDDISIIVSPESAKLSSPVDISVDENGLIYVLDYDAAQIMVFSGDGALVRTIGRLGSGPREFKRPDRFTLTEDSLWVVDRGNGRLQTLVLHGDFTRSVPLPPVSTMGPIAVGHEGGFLITTFGMYGTLAAYHAPSGVQQATLGTPLDSVPHMMNPRRSKEDLVAGRIPAHWRNSVLPVISPEGDFWLILNAEGRLQHYQSDGSLQVSVPLEAPEMKLVWEEVVSEAKATLHDQQSVRALRYVLDATVAGGTLWMLLNTTETGPAVLLAVGPDGQVRRRIRFTNVRGATSFALDSARSKVYFAIPSGPSVAASSFPAGGRGS